MISSKSTGIFILICLLILLSNLKIYAQEADRDLSLKIKNGILSAKLDSVELSKVDGYDRVTIKGLNNFAAPGEPLLPIKTVKYLIPYGKKVAGVSVGWTSKKYLCGTYLIEPAQAPVPFSFEGKAKRTPPNPAVYSYTTVYPEEVFEVVSVQKMRGYKILIINLHLIEYIPATGRLAYYENLNLKITLADEAISLGNNTFYRGIEADKRAVSGIVDNPEDAASYPLNKYSNLATYDYVIITNSALESYSGANSLNDLITHKQSKGLTTAIVNTTWIYANYSGTRPDGGNDNATSIRNFIKDYYTTYSTQYVLLVGDGDASGVASGETEAAPIIPHRGFYGMVNGTVSSDPDSDIPCDMYYGCLGGTFDDDADGVYGETNDGVSGTDIDLLAEVYIGRAPVDSTTELSNFVKKTIAYENTNASYLTSACFAAEQLDSETYGKGYMEEIRNGSSANGYTTRGMAETGYFSYTTLYDQDATWITSSLVAIMNAGVHVINHLGHASNTLFSKTMANADVDGLTNTDYFFGYTQGCYSGAFDNRNSSGTYETSDCVLEHFTTEANGAFAFIGNSRYGWYCAGGTDGPSQRLHREFWDAVVYEGITNIGKALQDAKQDFVGLVGSYNAERWVYFTTNLLGDPQTPLNAAFLSPTDFSANIVAFANNSWVTLSWKNSIRANLTHVMIRYRTDGTYPTSETDGTLLLSKTAVPGTTETYNHTDIAAGTTYHYVAFGYDGTNYEGAAATTNRGTVTVLQGSGSVSDSGGGSSNCFVATACYGNQYAPEVMKLRKFRDNYLMRDYRGREFISLYYIVGPKLAAMIEHNNFAKRTVRYWLGPVVRILKIFNKGDL